VPTQGGGTGMEAGRFLGTISGLHSVDVVAAILSS
jgi:hypothetical protein